MAGQQVDPKLRRRPSRLATALAVALAPIAGGPAGAAHIRAVLEAETLRPTAGSRLTLALHMTPATGWHGYWQNPGDAGAPTHVVWALPGGVEVGPLRYPVPRRMMTGQLMNYVYEQPYALLMTLRVPGGLAAGTPLRIAGKARWLACSATLCVPEQGAVSIDLVVGDGKVVPVVGTRFAQWRARLPAALNRTAGFERRAGRITLSIPFPRDKPLADPYFYPASDRVIDYAAPQRITRRGNRLIVEAKAAVDGQSVASIEGVLATGGDRGFSVAASPR